MNEQTYEFKCTECGYHPKKWSLMLIEKWHLNTDSTFSDLVDCPKFWDGTEKAINAKDLKDQTIPGLQI